MKKLKEGSVRVLYRGRRPLLSRSFLACRSNFDAGPPSSSSSSLSPPLDTLNTLTQLTMIPSAVHKVAVRSMGILHVLESDNLHLEREFCVLRHADTLMEEGQQPVGNPVSHRKYLKLYACHKSARAAPEV